MSWIDKEGSRGPRRAHTLAEPLDQQRALCRIPVVDAPYLDERENCPTCRPPQPPRNPDFPKRLPRHECPDCNATHIIGRNV